MKHLNLDIIGYWVIGAGFQIEKDQELSPSPLDCSKDSLKLLPLLPADIYIYIYIYISAGQVWWLNKLWFKRYIQNASCLICSCANTHFDVTDLVNHGMVKNTKIWISWESNMTILWNKKILNLCLKWHILKS